MCLWRGEDAREPDRACQRDGPRMSVGGWAGGRRVDWRAEQGRAESSSVEERRVSWMRALIFSCMYA